MYHFPFFPRCCYDLNIQTPQGHITQQGDDSSILETIIVDLRYTCVYLDTLLEISSNTRGVKGYRCSVAPPVGRTRYWP